MKGKRIKTSPTIYVGKVGTYQLIEGNSTETMPAHATCKGQPQPRQSRSDCQESGVRASAVLLADHDGMHAQQIIQSLRARGIGVDFCVRLQHAANRLKRIGAEYEVVIVNISDISQPWLSLLRLLRESSIQSGVKIEPQLLCVSTILYDAHFELQIERMRGRLVYER
jgi:hypothetical protein